MSYFFDKMLIKNEKNSYNLLIYLWFLLTKMERKKMVFGKKARINFY